MNWRRMVRACVAATALVASAGWAADGSGLLETGSRSRYAHRISLYDSQGRVISPTDSPAQPYSPSRTCGKCHDYQAVSGGWHFNAGREGAAAGRPGEPWIYVDSASATQAPLSYRPWPGLHTPEQFGLNSLEFVLRFGRHMPGGGAAAPADPKGRWAVTGPLEIDCLHCHSADARHNQAEQEQQVARQNFRYSPTVAVHLADVRGDVRSLSDEWDWEFGDIMNPQATAPTVKYYEHQFDANDAVFLDITRRMDADRCYFCHSFRPVGSKAPPRWQRDRDVHLGVGMTCADCHRNGLDHAIARGFEGHERSAANSLTCRTCHYGDPASADPVAQMGRRLGAPRPLHAGLPPVHLEAISCTACHSGPWPQATPQRVQTSMAHGLGLAVKPRSADHLPIIKAPVFVRAESGQIEPHRMMWPAYWGRLKDGAVTPIPPGGLPKAVVAALAPPKDESAGEKTPPARPTEAQIAAALKTFGEPTEAGEAVYLANGRLYRLGADGALTAEEHAAAEAYSWALAHDVRPAAQSLGARGCQDCHAADAPFLFAAVTPAGAIRDESWLRTVVDGPDRRLMAAYEGLNAGFHRRFAGSFVFRPMLKVTGFAAAAAVLAVLLLYGFKALAALLSGRRSADEELRPPTMARRLWDGLVYLALAVSFTTLAVSSFAPLARDGVVRGYWLIIHSTAGGVFAVALAVAALSWAHRCRLGRPPAPRGAAGGADRLQGIAFWLVLTLGLVSLLSMMLSMIKLFGTAGLEIMRLVHLYSAIALLAVAAVHLARLQIRPGRSRRAA